MLLVRYEIWGGLAKIFSTFWISISHDFWSILKRFSFDVPFRLLDRFRIDLESMIHRFWNGFHFWLRPILDRFLIDCWSILNCNFFSFFQKSRKHAQNAKKTGLSSQCFVNEKRIFSFSEYHINALKNCGFFYTRNVDFPFNFWSFSIDCWTTSAIEKKSIWNSSEKSTFRAWKKPHF